MLASRDRLDVIHLIPVRVLHVGCGFDKIAAMKETIK
jgi:hypothetical protein